MYRSFTRCSLANATHTHTHSLDSTIHMHRVSQPVGRSAGRAYTISISHAYQMQHFLFFSLVAFRTSSHFRFNGMAYNDRQPAPEHSPAKAAHSKVKKQNETRKGEVKTETLEATAYNALYCYNFTAHRHGIAIRHIWVSDFSLHL